MLTLVIGRREQGKTTLAYAIALQSPTRVIFDPRKTFRTIESLDVVRSVSAAEPSVYDLLDTDPELLVQPRDDVKNNFDLLTLEVSQWVENNPDEKICLLCDEVLFIETPDTDYVGLDRLTRFSDRRMCDVILTCHRPGDVSTGLRAIADFWCIFHTTQEHDLKVIRERCGEEAANIVDNLKPREYLLWNDGIGNYTVKRDPSAWFVDLKKASVTTA